MTNALQQIKNYIALLVLFSIIKKEGLLNPKFAEVTNLTKKLMLLQSLRELLYVAQVPQKYKVNLSYSLRSRELENQAQQMLQT